ncbi:hypothetical protein CFP56_010001 [Quercus suber]|uniref:Uncharacterized protein n=1 Tax=Quercus suber TaxID=58331 RepID=A0AAW0KZY6_QUESU
MGQSCVRRHSSSSFEPMMEVQDHNEHNEEKKMLPPPVGTFQTPEELLKHESTGKEGEVVDSEKNATVLIKKVNFMRPGFVKFVSKFMGHGHEARDTNKSVTVSMGHQNSSGAQLIAIDNITNHLRNSD